VIGEVMDPASLSEEAEVRWSGAFTIESHVPHE
jgi:hypothetical protein